MNNLPNYEKEIRPWGNFERFTLNEESTVKLITVSPNGSLSLQKHSHRKEFWKIISGTGTVNVAGEVTDIVAGDTYFISEGEEHRVEAGDEQVIFLEIAFGEFDENDIERLEDKYNRV